jgi:anti-repressor protein
MNNTPIVFEHPKFGQVRTGYDEQGRPYLVAIDICRALGIQNSRDALAQLDEDEKGDVGITDVIGRVQKTAIVYEPGFYSLVLRSRKPEAKEFKRWVTHEVLPSIHRTGSYSSVLNTPTPRPTLEELARGVLNQCREIKELEATVQEQNAVIAEFKPKAFFYETYLKDKFFRSDLFAKILRQGGFKVSRNSFIVLLRDELRWTSKQKNSRDLPNDKGLDTKYICLGPNWLGKPVKSLPKDWTPLKNGANCATFVTPLGALYFFNYYEKEGLDRARGIFNNLRTAIKQALILWPGEKVDSNG